MFELAASRLASRPDPRSLWVDPAPSWPDLRWQPLPAALLGLLLRRERVGRARLAARPTASAHGGAEAFVPPEAAICVLLPRRRPAAHAAAADSSLVSVAAAGRR